MKVFVSSTYVDLKDHRKAVDEIINRLCQQFRGMEYFGSRPYEPKKACFEEIDQCQAFIGIYAHRYGWIPPSDSRSITEQEFDYAREKGLDCFCYVVDPTFPWLPEFIEHEAADELQAFKQKVGQLVRSQFTTPDNLAKQVAADISRWVSQQLQIYPSRTALVPNNLPSRVEFVGREEERAKLKEILSSGLSLTVVEGPPGSGKTSLVLEVAYEYLDEARTGLVSPPNMGKRAKAVEAFIWLSARYREISISNLLDTIALILDYPYIASLDIEEKERRTRELLQRIRCLIIIDNFETIGPDVDNILTFLSTLPEPSQAIITTRYHRVIKGRTMMLSNLSPEDGIIFIRHEAKRLSLASVATAPDEALSRLYDATGGSPLAIEWALGQMKQRGLALDSIVTAILQGRGDVFKDLFGSAWESLTEDAKRLLMAITIFRTGASKSALEASSDISSPRLDEAIAQLVELSLFEVSQVLEQVRIRYSLHPLTHAFANAEASKMPDFIDEAHARAVEYFIEFARQRRETEVSGEEAREVEAELDNILYLLTWCSQGGKWHYVADLVGAVEELLFILGLFDERVAYSRDAALACEKMGDLGRKAHFLILVGGTLPLQGKYGDAEKALNEALQSARSAHNDSEVSRALRTLSLNAYRQGRYGQAEELLKGTDELALRASDVHNYVDILYLRGCIEFMQGSYGKSEATLRLMLETSEKIKWERAKAYALRELGEIAELRGDYAQAKESFESGLTIASSYGDRRQIARLQMSLANLSMYMGNLSRAEKLALGAQDTFERLGMWNELAEVEAILNILRRQPKWLWSLITRISRPRVRYTDRPIGGD